MNIESKMEKRKYIPVAIERQLVFNQDNKCANSVDKPALNLADYTCGLWILYNGYFDNAGYEIDHINERCITGNDSIENLQLLCPNCHSVKSKKFAHNKNKFTTSEMADGRQFMDIDNKKKRKI